MLYEARAKALKQKRNGDKQMNKPLHILVKAYSRKAIFRFRKQCFVCVCVCVCVSAGVVLRIFRSGVESRKMKTTNGSVDKCDRKAVGFVLISPSELIAFIVIWFFDPSFVFARYYTYLCLHSCNTNVNLSIAKSR